MRIVVAKLDEFPTGERRIVQVGQRTIGVFRVGDRFYAMNNYCPHMGGPLCEGRTKPWLSSAAPGEFVLDEQEALVACPWHGWEYDLATGQSFLGPGEPPARAYEVTVERGTPERIAGGRNGRRPGPYVAETFPVHVEDSYVVVDTSSRPVAAGAAGGER
ncbi:ferredoxin [Pseudonocardia sp. CNS-139]|nr:ferredoxin [Pseudonocardia sp. CNS-139]